VHQPGGRGVPGLRALRATGTRRAVLAGLGLMLFLISFAGANPGGAVSDEPDQYIKSIAAGHLDLLGTKVTIEQDESPAHQLSGLPRSGESLRDSFRPGSSVPGLHS
jgi:hypothetical protein